MFSHTDNSLTIAQQKTAAEVLGQAFATDPFMTHLFPDAETRVQKLTKLFLPVIRCSLHCGGIEITPDGGGVVIWLSGKFFESLPFKFLQLVRSGLIWLPLSIGLSAFKRLQAHDWSCEHALTKYAPKGFAYLWVIGVHPNYAGRGLGKQMLQSAMDAMRSHGYSACLLRTENPKNVGFYEHLGFKQIHTEIPSGSGQRFWLFSQELM